MFQFILAALGSSLFALAPTVSEVSVELILGVSGLVFITLTPLYHALIGGTVGIQHTLGVVYIVLSTQGYVIEDEMWQSLIIASHCITVVCLLLILLWNRHTFSLPNLFKYAAEEDRVQRDYQRYHDHAPPSYHHTHEEEPHYADELSKLGTPMKRKSGGIAEHIGDIGRSYIQATGVERGLRKLNKDEGLTDADRRKRGAEHLREWAGNMQRTLDSTPCRQF